MEGNRNPFGGGGGGGQIGAKPNFTSFQQQQQRPLRDTTNTFGRPSAPTQTRDAGVGAGAESGVLKNPFASAVQKGEERNNSDQSSLLRGTSQDSQPGPRSKRPFERGPQNHQPTSGASIRGEATQKTSHSFGQNSSRGGSAPRPQRRGSYHDRNIRDHAEDSRPPGLERRRLSGSHGRGGRGSGDLRGRGRSDSHGSFTRQGDQLADNNTETASHKSSELQAPGQPLLLSGTDLSGSFDREAILHWLKAVAASQNFELDDETYLSLVNILEERFDRPEINLAYKPIEDILKDSWASLHVSQVISTALLAASSGQSAEAALRSSFDSQTGEVQYPGTLDSSWISNWILNLFEKRKIPLTAKRLKELTFDTEEELEEQGYLTKQLNDVLLDETAVEHICGVFNRKFQGITIQEFWKIIAIISTTDPEETEKPIIMPPATSTSFTTPSLGQFLVQINGLIKAQNEKSLGEFVTLEPPFNESYQNIIKEVRTAFPKGSEDALEERCSSALTVARDGLDGSPNWTQFTKFMVQYLSYLRDVDADPSKYLETYELLYELQKRANSALNHASLGGLMLPIVINCARLICRLAIGLDKQPELIAHVKSAASEEGPRQTLPERAAELLRGGLVTCLNDRFSGLDGFGRPEGKKRGIYKIANICLKIFFQCRKTRNAEMIFTNIGNLSPPLSAYPKRERVTYLYYLGRFWFQNSHFYRARLALQAAYDESPATIECVRQRRHILIYLMASNIIMGRFPMPVLFERPEAQGLYERFMPIMQAIRSGNLALFKQHLDLDSPHADWFLHFRILLQLRNRCEVLVWRSLVRKAYMLFGTPYIPGEKSTAPLIDLNGLTTLFQALERQSLPPSYIDPDLDGASDLEEEDLLPSTTSIESILSSLVEQGFLTGFISHAKLKFVIQGAKQMGGNVLAAGFPQPWAAIEKRASGDRVPGWKLETARGGPVGGGMVLNLSGARPVGAA